MAKFMDIHSGFTGVTAEELREAHERDLEIEPAEGVEPSDELAAEILAYCAGRLARFKTPKTIDFTSEMPRDPNGKLYKRKLRDPYWEGVQRAL